MNDEYMPDYDQLGREVKQLEDSNEWLQERLDEMHKDQEWQIEERCRLMLTIKTHREALLGLMKLTAAAYGHEVDKVPEYVAARKAVGGE